MARNLIVINVDFKETRVALIEDGVIAELQIERAAHRSTVGNVVLGRVTRVLPGMQAAFIDVGQERAAFLHVEDLIRPDDFDAYLAGDAREGEKVKAGGRLAEGPESVRGAELPVAEGAADEADAAVMAAAQPGARRGRRRRGRRGRVKEPELQGRQRSTQPSAGSSLADRPGGARVPHGLREGSEGDIGSGDAGDVDAGDGGHEGEQSQTEVIAVRGAAVEESSSEPGATHLDFDAYDFGEDDESSAHGEHASADDEGSDDDEVFGADEDLEDDEFHADDDAFETDDDVDVDVDHDDDDDESDDDDADDDESDDDDADDDESDDVDTDDDESDDDVADDDESDDVDTDDDESDDDVADDDESDDDDDESDDDVDTDDDDDDDDDDVFGPDDPDDEDDEESDDEDLFGRDDDDDESDDHDVDGDDDESDDDDVFGPGEDDEVFVTGTQADSDLHDALSIESAPESGSFTEVEAVVLTGDRPSHVHLAPPADEEEPPSSGERKMAPLVDVIQPDVPAVARRTRQRGPRAPVESGGAVIAAETPGADTEEGTETALSADNRKRRGRRRRRRNGRPEALGSEVTPLEASADQVDPSEDVLEDEVADDNGRRRRRRGRRRGKLDSKPEVVAEPVSKNGARRMPARVSRSVPISEVVKEGNLVVVQISKEPIGTKGARVTSHVSLPGRYVVYLPTVDHIGISKRIGNARERARLRKSIEAIKPAHGGLIVRTVAEGLTKKQLKADIGYLIKVWADVAKRRETAKPAEVLYEELDLVLKAARDLFTDEVQQIVIDDRDQHGRLSRFVEMFMPGRVKDIKLYAGDEPIFDAYGIEDEIKRALSRKVPLPSGGSLVMDQAEALTAIDVNTGRYVGKGSKDLEETAFKTNLEAVDEIAYQLRFRNIGGLVILDLIDMEKAENRERVWRTLEQKLSKDKAKTTINRISDLGLIEMTRKRTRESLGRVMHEPCFYCDGTGHIQSRETIAYEILRQIRRDRMSLTGYSVRVLAHPAVVDFLKHEARDALQEAERRYLRRIELMPRQEYHIEQYDLQGR